MLLSCKARLIPKEQPTSDSFRRYRAIWGALTQGYPGQRAGTVARHVTTLAAMMSGIVVRQSTPLPSIATQVPDGVQAESRVTRCTRWGRKEPLPTAVDLGPYAKGFLAHLPSRPSCASSTAVWLGRAR